MMDFIGWATVAVLVVLFVCACTAFVELGLGWAGLL